MRTIEFRAKCFDGYWVYGDLHLLCSQPHIHTAESPYPFAGKRKFIDPDTIGQFTGLYDKNGVKIYEGDIVRWEYTDYDHYTGWRGTVKNVCKVTFEYGSFRINAYPYDLGSCEDFFENNETYGLEVIGNVYDNKELLTQK